VVHERRISAALLASCAVHAGMIAITLLSMRAALRGTTVPAHVDERHGSLIWRVGQSGGGGSGGDNTPLPPRRVERQGTDMRTVPAGPAPTIDPSRPVQPDVEPIPRLDIPVVPLASGAQMLPGAIDAPPAPPGASNGPGTGGGTGGHRGTGDGPGDGDGLGPGRDRGTGGGPFQIGGDDVTPPIEIRRGSPQYTTAAMQARAQGTILIECVVQTTGVCTNIRVRRSFNPPFGLDEQAMKAAADWRFRPAMRRGQPVPVLVTMEIAFALR
jgi:periplasmic protein TonB